MAIDLWNNNVMKWTCFSEDAKNDKFLIIWHNLLNCEFLLTPNSQGEKIISICGNVAIWLVNLLLSIRVQTTLLASACHAMPLSDLKHGWLALKESFQLPSILR